MVLTAEPTVLDDAQARASRVAAPEPTAIPNPLQSAALASPDHPALLAAGQTWTAGDLLDGVQRAAGVLARGGVAPGKRVALVGPPSAEWVITFHAVGWLGAAVVPLAPKGTVEELEAGLEAARPDQVLLTHGLDPALRTALLARGARFVTELPHGPPVPERAWPLDEVRAVVLTSGSTGAPRPVELRTGQLVLSAFGSTIRLGHDPADRWLAVLPLHHVGGLSILSRCALLGTTVVLHDRFDARRVARTLDAGEVSIVSLVPAMLERVLDAREARPFPARLRAILLGGDAAPPALLERCRALKAPVALTWGMTETASQLATRRPGDLSPEGGVGAPLAFARVGVVDGRLTARGPIVENGALVTRDRGTVARGVVHVHGRVEDTIVTGGETVALAEIEAALRSHPALEDVALLGLADPRWGERPAALVVQREPVEPAALRAWCRQRLSEFKVPERIVAVDAIPRTPLGKLLRPKALALVTGEPLPEPAAAAPPGPTPVAAPAQGQEAEAHAEAPVEALKALEEASTRAGETPLAARLADLRTWLSGDLKAFDRAISDLAGAQAAHDQHGTQRAARHLLLQPGKRLRPMCLLLAARLGGRSLDGPVRDVAIAAELVHAATLLHDDVVDEGTERRGAPAARVVYGNSASVLAGDALFTEALRLVARAQRGCAALLPGGHGLLEGLLAVIAEMVDAEALQLERRGRLDLSREAYLRVIKGKTASLFRWVLAAGGALAGCEPRHVEALGQAGNALGLAFQLVDDVLDLDGDPAETGKDAGADLRQGKVTWPLIVAAEREPGLRHELAALAAATDEEAPALAGRVTALIERVRAAGAIAATRTLAQAHAGAARAALATLPPGAARAALETVVEAAVERVS